MESKEFAEKICQNLLEHKAEDVCLICVKEKSSIADYFVVASGRSSTHTRSLCNDVIEYADTLGFGATREEGLREGRWAVIDYGDVIVHIFNDETRLFYHLEKLWENGDNITKFN